MSRKHWEELRERREAKEALEEAKQMRDFKMKAELAAKLYELHEDPSIAFKNDEKTDNYDKHNQFRKIILKLLPLVVCQVIGWMCLLWIVLENIDIRAHGAVPASPVQIFAELVLVFAAAYFGSSKTAVFVYCASIALIFLKSVTALISSVKVLNIFGILCCVAFTYILAEVFLRLLSKLIGRKKDGGNYIA